MCLMAGVMSRITAKSLFNIQLQLPFSQLVDFLSLPKYSPKQTIVPNSICSLNFEYMSHVTRFSLISHGSGKRWFKRKTITVDSFYSLCPVPAIMRSQGSIFSAFNIFQQIRRKLMCFHYFMCFFVHSASAQMSVSHATMQFLVPIKL